MLPQSDIAIKPVTLSDVAREAGVSLTTASQALSGKERVSARTRGRVREIAERLGYQANPLAKTLASGFSEHTVGLFALGLDLGVRTLKIQTVQSRLRQSGFAVPLYVCEEAEGQADLMRSLCRQRPRAILLELSGYTPLQPESWDELRRYRQSGGVVVAFDVDIPEDCDHVVYDREANAYFAARHLLELRHRRIGFRYQGTVAKPRQRGFARALAEYGLTIRPEWEFSEGLYEEGGARMAERVLAMRDRPTAFCIVNDVSAAVFLHHLQRAGVRVPEDVSIVGTDDTPAARFCSVPLTTVSNPVAEITQHVVDLVTSRLRGEYRGDARRIVVTGELVRRESSAPPPD